MNSSRRTKQRQPQAVELIEDLVIEIFLLLPVKSLYRFMCVSKTWLSLISNPQFCRHHTLHNPHPQVSTLLFYKMTSKDLHFVSLDGNRTTIPSLTFLDSAFTGTINVLQSCSGLLLCSIRNNYGVVRYVICNPITKQYTVLPNPTTKPNMVIVGINLAFDPLKPDQYKAVCIWKSNLPVTYLMEMYSSSSGSWRAVSDLFSAPFGSKFDHGVYWNGAIHWASPNNTALYFDVEKESLKTMALPPYHEYVSWRFQYFGVCHGHLHIIEIVTRAAPRFSVLEMGKDYSGWFLKCHVHLSDLGAQFPDMVVGSNRFTYYLYKVLSVVRGEKEEDLTLVLSLPGKIISYNPKDKSSRVLRGMPGSYADALGHRWSDNYLYTEMLSCF